jgi:hypothetical protein
MFRNRRPDPILFTITRLVGDAPEFAVEATTGMRPWRKAALAVAFVTAPWPAVATVANGTAGWTALVLVADVLTVAGVAISHGLAEAAYDPVPDAVIGVDLTDGHSHVHYDAPIRVTEAA